jgi:opacity protein-like surface antigen
MKQTLTAIAIALSITAAAQPYADISAGLTSSLRPAATFNFGLSTKYGEPFLTATWPLMAGVGYGYPLNGITPYAGYGTGGAFVGIRFRHYDAIAADVRVRRDVINLTFGWSFRRK